MEVKVCKNCRRLFKYLYGPELCQECAKQLIQDKYEGNEPKQSNESKQLYCQKDFGENKPMSAQNAVPNKTFGKTIRTIVKLEEDKFEQVRDYIMNHPGATVAEIAEVNDISPAKLLEWVKDDRLEFSDKAQYAWFNCEKCGAKIKSGRLCYRCKTK